MISVAMCTYNGEQYLRQQLESFVVQTRRPDEVVICDDRSSDSTVPILEEFAARAPFPVRIYRNERNLGSTQNFSQAISLCDGDLIALSDQDDIWKPEKLAAQAQIFETDHLAVGVFSDGSLIDTNAGPLADSLWSSLGFTVEMQSLVDREDPFSVLKKQYFITGATLMFRSSMRQFFGAIPEGWIHDAWITWNLAVHGKLIGLRAPLISYRLHAANQVGVNTLTPQQLLRTRTREQMIHLLAEELSQLRSLRGHLVATGGLRWREAVEWIDRRSHYLQKRLGIVSRRGPLRIIDALAAWPLYSEFGKGIRSCLGDLAL